MSEVFVDTAFIVASIDRTDNLHSVARKVAASLLRVQLVTTEEVLTEVLNYFAEWGPEARGAAVLAIDRIRSRPATLVVPQTSDGFDRALQRYRERLDKGYSLTDCGSMRIMEDRGIVDILTSDRHFAQAGFRPLLAVEQG